VFVPVADIAVVNERVENPFGLLAGVAVWIHYAALGEILFPDLIRGGFDAWGDVAVGGWDGPGNADEVGELLLRAVMFFREGPWP